jgi:hypothetical protein
MMHGSSTVGGHDRAIPFERRLVEKSLGDGDRDRERGALTSNV